MAERTKGNRPLLFVTLGFNAHTGWAAMVAIAAREGGDEVLDRRRVELVTDAADRFAFHSAQKLNDLAAAKKFIARVTALARKAADEALAKIVSELRGRDFDVADVGVVLGNTRLPTSLEKILSAHPLLHSAEGELFRNAIVEAAGAAGLRVIGTPNKELPSVAARALGIKPASLEKRLADLGKAAGRPWSQDQRDATLAAWAARSC